MEVKMIYGHMVLNSKRSAQEELSLAEGKVFCLDCNEVEELKIEDFGFDDHFGGTSDYRVVTENCEGTNWVKAECEVCGTDGDEPSKKLIRPPKDSDYRVVCEKCYWEVKRELIEENGMTEYSKDYSPSMGGWVDL
jgi:hypothetical protein